MRIFTLKHFRPVISTGLVCLAAALVLSSCSKKPQQAIIGKWNVKDQSTTVEFRKDGTFVTMENGKETPATYKFLNDTNVEMQVSTLVGTNKIFMRVTFELAVHGDSADMSITAPSRPGEPPKTQTMHLNRAK